MEEEEHTLISRLRYGYYDYTTHVCHRWFPEDEDNWAKDKDLKRMRCMLLYESSGQLRMSLQLYMFPHLHASAYMSLVPVRALAVP